MTSRKEKHERGLAKRRRLLEEYRMSGLEALRKDRARRFQKELEAWEENHNKNHRSEGKMIVECPHCRMIAAAQRRSSSNQLSLKAG